MNVRGFVVAAAATVTAAVVVVTVAIIAVVECQFGYIVVLCFVVGSFVFTARYVYLKQENERNKKS